MSTANFLTVKSHFSDLKTGSDTVSEASESGTSNSITSAEDLQKLAVILGLNNVEDVYQERFRVDRRRLENMIVETSEESQTAFTFFHRVMNETNTQIFWPARLKIGARSKKDPHVRVAGRIEDVKLAREKIMQLLDTRCNRITMKIDVSYTDHSHIIGKGGLTIKRVMEETGCHIHFPDSNRTSAVEKSNQVSIAGDMERVERARARVRALTPLVFTFELPNTGSSGLPDVNSPFVHQIQDKYKVQVMLRSRHKLQATVMVIKGLQWEVQATMEATSLLLNYMCGSVANQTKVRMTLEISPMHHHVVMGHGAEQLKVIMQGTNTQISFPDANDPNVPIIRKSCVSISGNVTDVYAARQQLIGCLPVVVIFDVPDENNKMEQDICQIMQKHNVCVSIRRKPKQGISTVVIKGIERCAGDVYEARRDLLSGKEPAITAEIPESYNIPSYTTSVVQNFNCYNPFSPPQNNSNNQSPCSPCNPMSSPMPYNFTPLQIPDLSNFVGINGPIFNPQHPPTPGGYATSLSPVALTPPIFPNTWVMPSPQSHGSPFGYPNSLPVPGPNPISYSNQPGNENSWNAMINSDGSVGIMQQPVMTHPPYQHTFGNKLPPTLNQLLNISSQASSGYQSNFTGSSVSLDTHSISGGESSNIVSPSMSPISKTHSPTSSNDADRSQNDLANIISELPLADRRAVGCEKKTLETIQARCSPLADYNSMKADANKAMNENIGSAYRIPTPRWSGYFFSRTSPSTINMKDDKNVTPTPDKTWNRPELTRPNIAVTSPASSPATPQHSPLQVTPRPCRYQQLYELLSDCSLSKYVDLFKQHELDIGTFASLNEADLVEIGVAAFGARRKMLLIIAELKKQGASPSGERKLINTPPQYNTAALRQDKW